MAKLNEAKELVDTLKRKAAEQSQILADKQAEADSSLGEITETMQVSGTLVFCTTGFPQRLEILKNEKS